MQKEQVLDIGIGPGGPYIPRNTAPNEQRIGLDTRRVHMLGLGNYPEVFPVIANARKLPFGTSMLSRIEMVLPFNELILPGLQNDHFALLEEHREECRLTNPHGWYPEFQRVLEPYGELVIYADLWVDPQQVKTTSSGYFEIEQVYQLTLDEFSALGTPTVRSLLSRSQGSYVEKIGKMWDDTLVQICLRSTKSPKSPVKALSASTHVGQDMELDRG